MDKKDLRHLKRKELIDLIDKMQTDSDLVSNEEFVYVNQKINRIQYLIQIQIQGIMNRERR